MLRALASTLLLFTIAEPLSAETIHEQSIGITVTVEENGHYAIRTADPNWVFTGTLPVAASGLKTLAGHDGIGDFDEITFTFGAREGSIRTYPNRAAVLFTDRYTTDTANAEGFPKLSVSPEVPGRLSFRGKWSQFQFDLSGTEGPWVYFDDAGRSFLLSSASEFMVANLHLTDAHEIESRINPRIKDIPGGLTHRTLLVVANGINRAFDAWGHALTDLNGKVRPANDADPSLKSLGYWTDNGASYYYNYDDSLGYTGTLLAVKDEFAKKGLALGYMQIDSWWYPKGEDGHWNHFPPWNPEGIYRYEAHPDIFPKGLGGFQKDLGLPLITHARWIDAKSPYRQKYKMSNNVIVDPAYWTMVGTLLHDSGVFGYEQDWMDEWATADYNLADQNAFVDNMDRMSDKFGLSMQYCMATPRHFLQSTKYGKLTTVRVSEDVFTRDKWDQFFYSSRLASAVGVYPFTDVFGSPEKISTLIATLSAGIVGVGDGLGEVNAENLLYAVRPDGIIVKPDVPAVPTDESILNDAHNAGEPLVSYTYTDHGPMRALYIFAHPRTDDRTFTFTPEKLGLSGKVYVYNWLSGRGRRINGNEPWTQTIHGDPSYLVAVPVGDSGIAFVGDTGKFVPLGKKRVSELTDDGAINATIDFAPTEESTTVHGWSPSAPVVAAIRGSVSAVTYDSDSGRFDVEVFPGRSGSARIRISNTIRRHPAKPQRLQAF
ncbi:MAG: hypothetical protein JO093_18855 [Acidobacteria bacterium]|nr:hypothetical protein [Acidobacteriota bacterium]MBV9187683.1 hypothetical protein [Acidobacteriota bacterium]